MAQGDFIRHGETRTDMAYAAEEDLYALLGDLEKLISTEEANDD